MALQASGLISLSQVNLEMSYSATAQISLNDVAIRGLFVKSSGAIAIGDAYGKANRKAISYVFSTHAANATLNLSAIPEYVAGISDITITVNSGVYLYASTTANVGLALSGGVAGDTLTLVNNGFIIGCGGNAGAIGGAGSNALSLGMSTTINNTNAAAYIAGGGGGGANGTSGGGGGAGGGSGGVSSNASGGPGGGGGLGAVGGNAYGGGGLGTGGGSGGGAGYGVGTKPTIYGAGGGGGRVLPGTGGSGGGGAGNAAGTGGGGGGWGASASGVGGKAVALNGKSVTWVSGNTARVYGAIA